MHAVGKQSCPKKDVVKENVSGQKDHVLPGLG